MKYYESKRMPNNLEEDVADEVLGSRWERGV